MEAWNCGDVGDSRCHLRLVLSAAFDIALVF